jgi:hypothetical protein
VAHPTTGQELEPPAHLSRDLGDVHHADAGGR